MSSDSEESSSSGYSEGSALEVVLDAQGRITGSADLALDYAFASCDMSPFLRTPAGGATELVVDTLKRDVDAIFDGQTTFWMPAVGFEARTTFERLAQQIFEYHTRHLSAEQRAAVDWSRSGAEYWTQRRELKTCTPAEDPDGLTGPTTLQNDCTTIRFHWDKDEDLVDETEGDITVHPQISTVTYLTDGGSPTIILPHVYKQNDPGEGEGEGAVEPSDSNIECAFASYPKLCKHVSFDGRFLHGCPGALAVDPPPGDGVRMTFLVNLWIGWKPLGPEIFPDEHLSLLSNLPEAEFDLSAMPSAASHASTIQSGDASPFQAFFGPNAYDKTLTLYWPSHGVVKQLIDSSDSTSFCFHYPESIAATVSCTQQPRLKNVPALIRSCDMSAGGMKEAYETHRILLIRAALTTPNVVNRPNKVLSELQSVYERYPKQLAEAWLLREGKKDTHSAKRLLGAAPSSGKSKKAAGVENATADGSWLAEINLGVGTDGDLVEALKCTCRSNAAALSVFGWAEPEVMPTTIYFGLMSSSTARKKVRAPDGEDEDGASRDVPSMYVQHGGSARWTLRPNLATNWPSGVLPPEVETRNGSLSVTLSAGDVMVVNRTLWCGHIEQTAEGDGSARSSRRKRTAPAGNLDGFCFGVFVEPK